METKDINIASRQYAGYFKNLETALVKYKIVGVHEDSVMEAYFSSAPAFLNNVDLFFATCHKLCLEKYEFIDLKIDEIQEIYHDDMYEDEVIEYLPVEYSNLFMALKAHEQYLNGFFDSVMESSKESINVYQNKYKGRFTNSYIFFAGGYVALFDY